MALIFEICVEIKLTDNEKKMFDHSVESVKKLNELATSIEQLGVIQPITVRKMQ